MAINKTGIAITIKAFLPIGKTLEEQLAALTMVKEAHETGDYAAVLKAAIVDEVKSEQKTRRVKEEPEITIDPETGRAALAGPNPTAASPSILAKAQSMESMGVAWKGLEDEAIAENIRLAEEAARIASEAQDADDEYIPPALEDDEFGGAPIDNEFGEDDVIPSGAAG